MIATATATAPAAGTFVTARPWVDGTETAPTRGIVGERWGAEHVIVWFPTMHEGRMVIGRSVQPILIAKLVEVTPIDEVAKTPVRNAYRAARRANLAGDLPREMRPAGFALEAADRRRRAR